MSHDLEDIVNVVEGRRFVVDDLEAALEQFRLIAGDLEVDVEAVLTFDARG